MYRSTAYVWFDTEYSSLEIAQAVLERDFGRVADGGVDADFSLDPGEFASLVRETKIAWQAMGEARIGPKEIEAEG